MKRKAVKKNLNKPGHPLLPIVAIFGVIIVFIIILLLKTGELHQSPYQNQTIIPAIKPSAQNFPGKFNSIIPITPTVFHTSRQGWLKFTYPDPNKKYSFEYPSQSNLGVYNDRNLDFIKVDLRNIGDYSSCEIHFNGLANDQPWQGTATNKESVYAGRKANLKIVSKDSIPYAEFISFEDSIRDPFSFVQAFFPLTNNASCQQLVNQILSTLKFYY